ncbi:hypothetical protein ACIPYQ_30990 [Streptomyces sp. NPDC090045]|uniref:hypothetical protein n=1 Tax=Streptomyces sp. NPDC090045 TaxID=3365927 RepID=UPI00380FE55A
MAIIAIIELPGVGKDQYQANHASIFAAPWWPAAGFISHAGAPANGGWLVVDLWESKEALGAFMEQAAPIFQANGMPRAEPKIYEATNVDIG